jgi:hypothetical protein
LISQQDDSLTGQFIECGQITCAGRSDLERSLIEAGLRFFHDFAAAPDANGVAFGLEPFFAIFNEDNESAIGVIAGGSFEPSALRSSELEATAFGALLALDGQYYISPRIALTGRIAAGAYHLDAEADTIFRSLAEVSPVTDELSSDSFGFRGQLALGIDHALTDEVSLGVIGRLDYWSDFPFIEWTTGAPGDNNSIGEEDFLALSVGARLTFRLGSPTAAP